MAADLRRRAGQQHIPYLAAPGLASAGFCACLHEQVITGPAPFAQLAINYRDRTPVHVTIGPDLIGHPAERVFGKDTSCCYSFPGRARQALDAGQHRLQPAQAPAASLDERPGEATTMVETGRAALASYAAFMAECAQLAKSDLKPEPVPA